jgi:hypothetical protein
MKAEIWSFCCDTVWHLSNILWYQGSQPVTVAERSKVCTVFARSEDGIVGSIPYKAWMFGMCMCLFCVCVVLCLGRGLATSRSPVRGVLPSVKWLWNWKSEARTQGGCKTSEKKSRLTTQKISKLISLSTLFSGTCYSRSSLNERDHNSHPFKTYENLISISQPSAFWAENCQP